MIKVLEDEMLIPRLKKKKIEISKIQNDLNKHTYFEYQCSIQKFKAPLVV